MTHTSFFRTERRQAIVLGGGSSEWRIEVAVQIVVLSVA